MYKISVFCATLFLVCANLNAQTSNANIKRTNFWVGPQTSVAVGELARTQSFGVGAQARLLHRVGPKTELGGTVNYTYLFGKNLSSGYETGGYYNYESKSPGASDIGISGSIRQNLGGPWYGGGDIGICFGSEGGVESLFSFAFEREIPFGSTLSALAFYLGICGDPKLQIGIRYVIRL